MYYCVQTVESSLQHKVDMVSRLEQKTTQMAATIRDMEDGSVCLICYCDSYDKLHCVWSQLTLLWYATVKECRQCYQCISVGGWSVTWVNYSQTQTAGWNEITLAMAVVFDGAWV